MPSVLPKGDPAPTDGMLPKSAAEESSDRNFGVYLHVPFCRVRCGYCDFNTYTATELRGVKQGDYPDQAIAEIKFAAGVLLDSGLPEREVSTVFFGGGTPTLLGATDLARMLEAVRETWGLENSAEVTTEANPDSIDQKGLQALAEAGFTRISFGMQSAVPKVLAVLDRTHDPEQVPRVVDWAKEAGLEVSLDLIYGAPGETLGDWQESLETALALEPNHLSAYALIVEDGTKLERQIRRGEMPAPDEDLMADKYELADRLLADAGYEWYEVSNWSRGLEHRSRHNLAYWTGEDWWGVGPGAHSHIGGVRWWNVKHPAAYAERILGGNSPAFAREILDGQTKQLERILLETRISDGYQVMNPDQKTRESIAGLIADGLVEPKPALTNRIVLTLRGRLLADAVVRALAFQS